MSQSQAVEAPVVDTVMTLKKKQSLSTMVTLASMVELASRVSEKIVGGEIASSFAGHSLNKEMVSQLTQSVVQKTVANALGE